KVDRSSGSSYTEKTREPVHSALKLEATEAIVDHRTESFARRFRSARPHLGTRDIQGLISMKYRDQPVNPSEYSHFIDEYLTRSLSFDVARVDGDFGAQAWLVTDKAHLGRARDWFG